MTDTPPLADEEDLVAVAAERETLEGFLEYHRRVLSGKLRGLSVRRAVIVLSCGAVKATLPLSERTYRCGCGLVTGRDINAAANLLNLAASGAESLVDGVLAGDGPTIVKACELAHLRGEVPRSNASFTQHFCSSLRCTLSFSE